MYSTWFKLHPTKYTLHGIMTFYKITLYNHALRNVPYVIYIALYEVHSTRNNDTLQKYALQTRST